MNHLLSFNFEYLLNTLHPPLTMKRINLLIILTTLFTALTANGQSVNESIAIDCKIHDFGTISETGGKVSHRFRFSNNGNEPVTILRARAGCNCISTSLPSQPIAPGSSAYITVTFDPDYRPGHFSKEIVVYSNGNRYNRIWVKGDVAAGTHDLKENYRYNLGAGILVDYKVMNFATVKPGSTTTKTLAVANDSDRTVRLDFEIERADPSVTIDSGCILKPHSEASVNITVAPTATFAGPKTIKIYPVADGRTLQPIEITFKTR